MGRLASLFEHDILTMRVNKYPDNLGTEGSTQRKHDQTDAVMLLSTFWPNRADGRGRPVQQNETVSSHTVTKNICLEEVSEKNQHTVFREAAVFPP